ncbi:hypothetical protein OJF2_63710 [Aquisphaera giovannonii]|uniref:Uncharacterized protein n=1 Tax=Aquisphaera giovannonii TaxID=406548 RepID=A0A5B9WD20_9BACT|nr:hypothetical protein [Aquisphaera giovannonii]QEH37780.1 hypothetical protein OJF2_63710 [Aquisphaera giovannonii]
MLSRSRRRLPNLAVLLVGLLMGWGMSSLRPASLHAGGGDRSGESIVATGPILVRYDETNKIQVPTEALYLLDYRSGRLVATVPALHQTGATSKYFGAFAERDLVSDFKLDLDTGPKPHFLMTTGSLGTYTSGWAPLYVFETSTGQVALYRVKEQTTGTTVSTQLELLETRSLVKAEKPEAGAAEKPQPPR